MCTWSLANKGIFYNQIVVAVLCTVTTQNDDIGSFRKSVAGSPEFYIADTRATVPEMFTTFL